MRLLPVVRPGLAYGGVLCLSYLATGLTRSLWMNSASGTLIAALWEAAVFLVAGVLTLSAWLRPGKLGAKAEQHPVLTGLIALGCFVLADALIAGLLCGVPLLKHLGRFWDLEGRIQLLALLLYAALPLIWFHEQQPGKGVASGR